MNDIDDTQNWVTLRARHQVTCQDCETLITLLEQERDALRRENEKFKSALKEISQASALMGINSITGTITIGELTRIAKAALEAK